MMSPSAGLKPRAVAGGPSVTRFTHNNWTGTSPSGRPTLVRSERESRAEEKNIRAPKKWRGRKKKIEAGPRAAVKKIEVTSPMFDEMR